MVAPIIHPNPPKSSSAVLHIMISFPNNTLRKHPAKNLFPESLFVLLMAHSKVHHAISRSDDTNNTRGNNGGAVGRLKDGLLRGARAPLRIETRRRTVFG